MTTTIDCNSTDKNQHEKVRKSSAKTFNNLGEKDKFLEKQTTRDHSRRNRQHE